jgi:hypothetical protein
MDADQRELKAPASPSGPSPSPSRRANSIRRTSTIDSSWPTGFRGPTVLFGRARDLQTHQRHAQTTVVAEDWIELEISPDGRIERLMANRHQKTLSELAGLPLGGRFRKAFSDALPQEVSAGSPLHLLLDDACSAYKVTPWVWTRWDKEIQRELRQAALPKLDAAGALRGVADVCAGYRQGSSGLGADGGPNLQLQSCTPVGDFRRADDAFGWHALTAQTGVAMRRARRMDAWLEGAVQVDAWFQDSGTAPGGDGRLAVHEYRLSAEADQMADQLISVNAVAAVLPFPECPSAVANVQRLVGQPLSTLRQMVLTELPGALGCTHLNDVLRCLADVPALVQCLDYGGPAPG